MRCAVCNRVMNSSLDDYEGGLCAKCTLKNRDGTKLTLPVREAITSPQETLSVPCIICGEDIESYKLNVPWMICDNCKKAVLYAREKLKGKGE